MSRIILIVIVAGWIIFSGCKKEEDSMAKTFNLSLGETIHDNHLKYYDFIIDENKNIVAAYGAATPEDLQDNYIDELVINLQKVDEAGQLIWKQQYDTEHLSRVYGLAKTNDGGFLLSGLIANQEAAPWENTSIYLIRTDSDGNKLWDKTYGAIGWGRKSYGLFEKEDGSIILLAEDGVKKILKLDADGNLLNETPIPGPYNWSLTLAENGDYITAGNGIIRFDESGQIVWSFSYSNNFGEDRKVLKQVKATGDGGFVAFGSIEYYNGIDAYESSDYLMLKVDGEGNLLWEQTFNDGPYDFGEDLSITPEGNYIVMGVTENMDGTSHLRAYNIDSEGNQVWLKQIRFNTESHVSPCAIQQPDDRFIVVMGIASYISQMSFSMRIRLMKTEI